MLCSRGAFVSSNLFTTIAELVLDDGRLLAQVILRRRFLLFERSLLPECPRLDVVLRGRETRPFLREVLLELADLSA
jgi:hypothetical protein